MTKILKKSQSEIRLRFLKIVLIDSQLCEQDPPPH